MRTSYLSLLMLLPLGPNVSVGGIKLVSKERMVEKADVIAVVTV